MPTPEDVAQALARWREELSASTERIGEVLAEPVRCDAYARRGTGYGWCDRPLDGHGQCDWASEHVEL